MVAELRGIPHASVCVVGCPFISGDRFPYGFGFGPPTDALEQIMAGVARAKHLQISAQEIDQWDCFRARLWLPRREQHPWLEPPSKWLIVVPTTDAFEYPGTDLPLQAHYIGPLFWDPASVGLPDIPGTEEPVIIVSQGSTFTRSLSIVRAALTALANEPIQVVVCTGRPYQAEELGPSRATPLSFPTYRLGRSFGEPTWQ